MLRLCKSPGKRLPLRFLSSLFAAGMFALCAGSFAHAADRGGSGSGAKRGDALFHQRCVVCHNKQPGNDSPFGPPNLYDAFREKKITTKEAETIIHNGKGNMPSFGKSISDAQIRDVIAYLTTHGK